MLSRTDLLIEYSEITTKTLSLKDVSENGNVILIFSSNSPDILGECHIEN